MRNVAHSNSPTRKLRAVSALRENLFGSSFATGLLARTRFPQRTRLHCAVSGGADSVALLLLAVRTEQAVTAWHINHGLRPESESEYSFVQSLAEHVGADFELRAVNIAPGANLEERARDARYDALPPDVLTGHTADDQAETVLMNLLRGSGTSGLAGMRSTDRPLLGLRRHETRELCATLGLAPLHDPMNEERRFQRVRVREQLLPLLNDISRRDIVDVLVRQATVLREDDDLLEEMAAMIDPTDAKTLASAPYALARRAVRQWLADPKPPDLATVERVLAVARGESIACDIGRGRAVRRSHQRLGIHTTP